MTDSGGSGTALPHPPVAALPHPAVDVTTPDVAVVLTDRAVVGMSSWLVDAVVTQTRAGRVPTLVTGPRGRVTPAVRLLAADRRLRWVVQHPDGRCHDALDGTALHFADGRFGVDDPPARAPEFATITDDDRAGAAWQVIVSATVEHRADVRTELGHGVEALSQALVGAAPAGWGLYEPVTEPWRPADLTTFARRRMPDPSQLVVITPPTAASGRTLQAVVTARRTARGVEEQLDVTACVGGLDLPFENVAARCHEALVALGEAVTVGFGWAYVRPGAADLTEAPRERAAPVPAAVLFGPRAVRALGTDHVRAAPLPAPTTVGRPRVPGFAWRVGGSDRSGWDDLTALAEHLGPRRIVEVSPAFAQLLGIS